MVRTPSPLKQINIDTLWTKTKGKFSLKEKSNSTVQQKIQTEKQKINQRQINIKDETVNVKKRKPTDKLPLHDKRPKTLPIADIFCSSKTEGEKAIILDCSNQSQSNMETVNLTENTSIFVVCPVCSKKIQENKVNNHLDLCLNSSFL